MVFVFDMFSLSSFKIHQASRNDKVKIQPARKQNGSRFTNADEYTPQDDSMSHL